MTVLALSHYIGMGSIGTGSGPGWLALGLIGFGLGWHWTWLAWSWLALDLVDSLGPGCLVGLGLGWLWAGLALQAGLLLGCPGWLWAGLAMELFPGLVGSVMGGVGFLPGCFLLPGLVGLVGGLTVGVCSITWILLIP